jgi:hypothetical protein
MFKTIFTKNRWAIISKWQENNYIAYDYYNTYGGHTESQDIFRDLIATLNKLGIKYE